MAEQAGIDFFSVGESHQAYFATIDLISDGRAEIVAGRASRVGLYELLGYRLFY